MAHKIVLGGFGSSEEQMQCAAADLSKHFNDEFLGLSFRQAQTDSKRLFSVTKGAEVYTHSAGFLALRHTQPESMHGIAPPLKATSLEIMGQAALCGYDAATDSLGRSTLRKKIIECGRELVTEVSLHAVANLGRVATIAAYDAVDAGIAAQKAGVRVGLGFMDNDRLFIPSYEDMQKAEDAQLPLTKLKGGHIDFLLRPVELAAEYRSGYQEELQRYGLAA